MHNTQVLVHINNSVKCTRSKETGEFKAQLDFDSLSLFVQLDIGVIKESGNKSRKTYK